MWYVLPCRSRWGSFCRAGSWSWARRSGRDRGQMHTCHPCHSGLQARDHFKEMFFLRLTRYLSVYFGETYLRFTQIRQEIPTKSMISRMFFVLYTEWPGFYIVHILRANTYRTQRVKPWRKKRAGNDRNDTLGSNINRHRGQSFGGKSTTRRFIL